MKNCWFCLILMTLLSIGPVHAQNTIQPEEIELAFPEVPRVSAYEAYTKYKAGKAIIVQAGGEAYEKRHILGAHDVSTEKVKQGQQQLPNFPMAGLDIYTYCY